MKWDALWLLVPVIWVIGAIGYVINVFKMFLMAMDGMAITAMFALRVVGIFVPPIGAIAGWL